MRRFGLAVVLFGAIALVSAFIPGVTIFALVVALVGLALGIPCLILDRSFNLAALIGTIVSSGAVSMAIIMGLVYEA